MKLLTSSDLKRLLALTREAFSFLTELRKRDTLAEEIQYPKVPPALSQSLAAYLFNTDVLGLSIRVFPSTSGGDLVGEMPDGTKITIEIKATGASNFQEIGKRDLDCDLLIWIAFGAYFLDSSQSTIQLTIMPKPKEHLPGPCKLTLKRFQADGNGRIVHALDLDAILKSAEITESQ